MEIHMKKAAGGDAEAFIWLMEENKHMLYKIAKGYLRREEEIADTLEINENTVKARLRRGRKYLAKKLGDKSGEV